MSSGSPGRHLHQQQTHYLRRTFNWNTAGFGTSGQGYVGTLPPGAIVRGTMVKVHTVFNSVSSDVVDVGNASDADAYVAAANLQLAGGQYAITGMDAAMPTAPTDVIALLTSAGGSLSAGSVTIIVEYFADNDQ